MLLNYVLLHDVLPILITFLPAAVLIILWRCTSREHEESLLWKTAGYFIFSIIRLSINAIIIPIGAVIAFILASRAQRNSSYKKYVVAVGLGCFLFSLLPIQSTVEEWLYPRDQMSTYLVADKLEEISYYITIDGSAEGWYALSDWQEVQGRELYEELLLSKAGHLPVTNARLYSMQIHQEHIPIPFRHLAKIVLEISNDLKQVTVVTENSRISFLTTERFQQLFTDMKGNS